MFNPTYFVLKSSKNRRLNREEEHITLQYHPCGSFLQDILPLLFFPEVQLLNSKKKIGDKMRPGTCKSKLDKKSF